jgi:hypothetical protein
VDSSIHEGAMKAPSMELDGVNKVMMGNKTLDISQAHEEIMPYEWGRW